MLFKQAGEFILNKLRTELPAHFTYHHVNHTLDVCSAARHIALHENINDRQLQLLLTAACYHDSGFLIGPDNHEEESCRIAKEALPGFGYNDDDMEAICGLIRATRIPQAPSNHLEQILADADLDYLGRDDFWEISEKLYREISFAGKVSNKREWDFMQVKFMENHHYFTQTAINARLAQKDINLAKIKAQINN